MKNVKKQQTRTGNPQWVHGLTNIDVYFSRVNGDKSKRAALYIHHKSLPAWELTQSESDKKQKSHEVYLKQITISSYSEVFEGYMNQIELLHELGYSPIDIITRIYEIEKGTKEPEIEIDALKTAFRKLDYDFKAQLDIVETEIKKLTSIQDEMNMICKEMEML